MIRLTEPMPCPRCRRTVVPGEDRWYDLMDDCTAGLVHVCGGVDIGYAERYEAAVERGKKRHKQMQADLVERAQSDGSITERTDG